MKNFILLLFLISLHLSPVNASVNIQTTSQIKCQLPQGESLTIGCTNQCGRFMRWALRWQARNLGYRINIVNLRTNNQSIDYTQVDGILIPGGSDIDPEWYISQVTTEFAQYLESIKHKANYTQIGKIRDEFEFNLLKSYFNNPRQKTQPILGICRGMQVLTVSQGIPLYVDIKTELGIKNRYYTLDRIHAHNPKTLISELVKLKHFRGVELHHQGLNVKYFNEHRDNWPQLDVTAFSNGGKIAEAIEFHNRPILGVQFHPEYMPGTRARRGIFSWLLKRACFNHVMADKLNKGL